MLGRDKACLERESHDLGFIRDTFEKTCRIADFLGFLAGDEMLRCCLALKGGTAVNLAVLNLPRLSVDADFDLTADVGRDELPTLRTEISAKIKNYMHASGYRLSDKKSKYSHALDSYEYEYTNAGGMKDYVKIEIDYMLRRHVFPVSERRIGSVWEADDIIVPCLDPREIFAAKTVALLSRSAPRDLCDVHNMIRSGVIDGDETWVRKCAVFYAAIASKGVPGRFEIERIENMDPHRIWTDLFPMLRKGERFNLPEVEMETEEYLSRVLVPDEGELEFWRDFGKREYRPEKLFQPGECLERIINHPMALWKCRSDG